MARRKLKPRASDHSLWRMRGLRPPFQKGCAPGPGQPRLPEEEKERRKFLRKKLQDISIKATDLIDEIVNDDKEETRDRLRAAEIALDHTLPKQEEVELNDTTPYAAVSVNQLIAAESLLVRCLETSVEPGTNGSGESQE